MHYNRFGKKDTLSMERDFEKRRIKNKYLLIIINI